MAVLTNTVQAAKQYCHEPLVNGTNTIYLTCVEVTAGNYQIKIEGENLNGLGGSFYNPGQVDLRSKITSSTATEIVIDISAASAPSLYTPLYVMMPNEVVFTWPSDITWGKCEDTGGGDTPEPLVNLALNKTAVAGHSAENGIPAANDGNLSTRWGSSGATHWTATNPDAAQDWWYVDLGNVYQIDNIRIFYETACPTDYDLLISSDAITWTTMGTYTEAPKTGNTADAANVYDFSAGNYVGRYVKIFARNGYNNFAWGFSIWEFEVYGTLAADSEPPVLSAATLKSVAYEEAKITIEATDNFAVTACKVVDAANGIDITLELIRDEITISGLRPNTTYNFTITALDGVGNSSVDSKVVTCKTRLMGENIALNKVAMAGYGADTHLAVDGNVTTRWGSNGGQHMGQAGVTEATAQDWIYVDLAGVYTIESVRFLFEGACPSDFDILVSKNATDWTKVAHITEHPLISTEGDQQYNTYTFETAEEARYVKLFARAADHGFAYGISIWEFEVYGTAITDSEKPVLTSATVQSVSYTEASIKIVGTDNTAITSCKVTDNGNGIDGIYPLTGDILTINGLTAATTYNFTIQAFDGAGNASDATVTVAATTKSRPVPTTAAPDPTVDASLVVPLYSDYYSVTNAMNPEGWVSPFAKTIHTIGENNYIYAVGTTTTFNGCAFNFNPTINVSTMKYFHIDVWVENDATIRLCLVSRGQPEPWLSVAVKANEWTSVKLPLSDFTNVAAWNDVWAMKIEGVQGSVLALDNLYFSKDPEVDNEAPVLESAVLGRYTHNSATIHVVATDNIEVTKYVVKDEANGIDIELAATDGRITITGLTPETAYNFTIWAKDAKENISEATNKTVAVTTKAAPLPGQYCQTPILDDSGTRTAYFTFKTVGTDKYKIIIEGSENCKLQNVGNFNVVITNMIGVPDWTVNTDDYGTITGTFSTEAGKLPEWSNGSHYFYIISPTGNVTFDKNIPTADVDWTNTCLPAGVELKKAYLIVQKGWTDWSDNVNAHYFGGSESTNWPGVSMTKESTTVAGEEVYSIECYSNNTHITFSKTDDANNQTKDIAIDWTKPYFYLYDGADTRHECAAFASADDAYKLTYYVNSKDWSGVNAYMWYWDGSENTDKNHERVAYPGEAMTLVDGVTDQWGKNVYSILVPRIYPYIKFSNASNQSDATADLTIEDNPYYRDGQWHASLDISNIVNFVNTQDWDNVSVYLYNEDKTDQVAWPGSCIEVPLPHQSGDGKNVYQHAWLKVDGNYDNIIFNNAPKNGSASKQTVDMSFANKTDYFFLPTGETDGKVTGIWRTNKNVFLAGSWTDWATNQLPMLATERTDDYAVYVDALLEANTNYTFKLHTGNDEWWSYNDCRFHKDWAANTITMDHENGNNMTVATDIKGIYRFIYDPTNNKLTVQFPVSPEITKAEYVSNTRSELVIAVEGNYTATKYVVNNQEYIPVDGKITLNIADYAIGTLHTLQVYAKDEAGNISVGYKELTFTIAACTVDKGAGAGLMTGTSLFEVGYTISVVKVSNTQLEIEAIYKDNLEGVGAVAYLEWYDENGNAQESGSIARTATDPRKFAGLITIPNHIQGKELIAFCLKFALPAGATKFTSLFYYDTSTMTCVDEQVFEIYHYDDAPTGGRVEEGRDMIPQPIAYKRKFRPGMWETLCVPFEVERVTVYDDGDGKDYELYAQYDNAGNTIEGSFWLRTFDVRGENVAVTAETFQNNWQDIRATSAAEALPKKNVPYIMMMPDVEGYYDDKYVVFHGRAYQTIATTYAQPAAPDDEHFAYSGNNTMIPQVLGHAYVLDAAGEYFDGAETVTLQPFECAVNATAKTVQRMPRLGLNRQVDVTTDTPRPTTADVSGEVYSLMGIYMGQYTNMDEQMALLQRLPQGLYVVKTNTEVTKIWVEE